MLMRNDVAEGRFSRPREERPIESDCWHIVKADKDAAPGIEVWLGIDGNEVSVRLRHPGGLILDTRVRVPHPDNRTPAGNQNFAVADCSSPEIDVPGRPDRRQNDRRQNDRRSILPRRQQEVLDLLISGRSNKEMARSMDLGVGTIKAHVSALLRNLGVSTRTAAAAQGAFELTNIDRPSTPRNGIGHTDVSISRPAVNTYISELMKLTT